MTGTDRSLESQQKDGSVNAGILWGGVQVREVVKLVTDPRGVFGTDAPQHAAAKFECVVERACVRHGHRSTKPHNPGGTGRVGMPPGEDPNLAFESDRRNRETADTPSPLFDRDRGIGASWDLPISGIVRDDKQGHEFWRVRDRLSVSTQ